MPEFSIHSKLSERKTKLLKDPEEQQIQQIDQKTNSALESSRRGCRKRLGTEELEGRMLRAVSVSSAMMVLLAILKILK